MRVKSIARGLLYAIGGLVGIVLPGLAIVFALIGRDLNRTFSIDSVTVTVPSDLQSITEGERLARTRGCFGCHGKSLQGTIFFELPDGTTVVAPNLPRVAGIHSNDELEQIVRHGIRPDGTSVIRVMPSDMYYNLSDADYGAIAAFLKSQVPGKESLPVTRVGPVARLMLMYFKHLDGSILAADLIDHVAPRLDPSTANPASFGRYLAMTSCTECHGTDLRGFAEDNTPSLAIVAAYSLDDFRTLMQTGEPIGGRKLDLMAVVALERFAHFTEPEITALHTFLKTLAATAESN